MAQRRRRGGILGSTPVMMIALFALLLGAVTTIATLALALSHVRAWRGAAPIAAVTLGFGIVLWGSLSRATGDGFGIATLFGIVGLVVGPRLLFFGAIFALIGAGNIVTGNVTTEMVLSLAGGLAAVGLAFVLKVMSGRALGIDDDHEA